MSKSYKKKQENEEVVLEENTLSKKELYDLEKKKKQALKVKALKNSKKKVSKKKSQTNLGARTFAIFMLVLMVGSVVVSALAYVIR